ncbi:hypothetical protein BZA70DRAFT_245834 [Myxozyma melibiosi]|uniref:RNA polymerase II subunit A C-terminal domain phosphatase n=1 Tax=Myxozyma melibiosi TaxID=54550 RepID=A0ABR1FCA7_9ASCO
MATEITLPSNLHYPITIVQLICQSGSEVQKNAPLFSYRYKTKVTQTIDINEEVEVDAELLASFDSPMEGTLGDWLIKEGDVIESSGLVAVSVSEPCTHAVQYAGMCALCGKDLTHRDYSGYNEAARADVQMFHKSKGLAVSMTEAERIEKTTTMALLTSGKLILVVDLDQTVIHTTVDPIIGEWKRNPDDPHYDAVKDVHSFCLQDGSNSQGYWYYVKVRPGLEEFLERISKKYELHIYTMATKSYAAAIAKIIDPTGKYFADRVLSRDESGNLEQKNLKRLFPVDTSLVVIIDDRGDVWKWSANLIKVVPFEFFVGIGDINSGFLPKQQDVKATGATTSGGTIAMPQEDKPVGKSSLSGDREDTELANIESSLMRVHDAYYTEYREYQKKKESQVVNKRKRKRPGDWREGLPDIKVIMPRIKQSVLDGVVILMSGTVPLGANLDSVDVVIWARSFGAKVVDTLAFDVTHLVAERTGTKKVHQATKFKGIHIVSPAWLYRCLSSWTHVDESDYVLAVSPNNAWEAESDSSSDFDLDDSDLDVASEAENDVFDAVVDDDGVVESIIPEKQSQDEEMDDGAVVVAEEPVVLPEQESETVEQAEESDESEA